MKFRKEMKKIERKSARIKMNFDWLKKYSGLY
jgi:hypothetical protein